MNLIFLGTLEGLIFISFTMILFFTVYFLNRHYQSIKYFIQNVAVTFSYFFLVFIIVWMMLVGIKVHCLHFDIKRRAGIIMAAQNLP